MKLYSIICSRLEDVCRERRNACQRLFSLQTGVHFVSPWQAGRLVSSGHFVKPPTGHQINHTDWYTNSTLVRPDFIANTSSIPLANGSPHDATTLPLQSHSPVPEAPLADVKEARPTSPLFPHPLAVTCLHVAMTRRSVSHT
ncbi:unnamed protein product [Protopolystoma xenopodis]|uniref:Uncharacterized protein n=1 Tax=Protopolystoma xenopodis TaxID=117903 RepID=A0A3S5FDD1_9PLAT|nr:unnamed protein product [Protopolystoma xenopodis]